MSLLNWIYPPKCMACHKIFAPVHGEIYPWICDNCRPLLIAVPDPICPNCGYPCTKGLSCPSCINKQMHFNSHRAAFIYDDVIRDLILDIKFRSRRRTAQGLGHILAEAAEGWNISGDYIVPIPMHFSKKRARGFNQAAILAHPFSKANRIPIAEGMIKRVKNTVPQSGLTAPAREQNLSGAFILNVKKYNPAHKQIILIDDIYTSGATMNACSKILMENNAKAVFCISLSIALK